MLIAAVETTDLIQRTAWLAREIWMEHYIPIIGRPQVEYMLDRFQSADAIQEQLKTGYRYYLVCLNPDAAVGYFAVVPRHPDLFLSKFYISPSYRGQGYGRQVFLYIEELARTFQCTRISLNVNKQNSVSIAIYQKMGFRILEDIVQDIGNGFVMDDYRMAKMVDAGGV
ncbi:MAG TPA: GNAT family N-acetyltransferase [Candidatus Bathyarchaeia archaeon]|nr:GNAT family N-acetyltransferase [Candidatus Bathyarchaeia archaeon]